MTNQEETLTLFGFLESDTTKHFETVYVVIKNSGDEVADHFFLNVAHPIPSAVFEYLDYGVEEASMYADGKVQVWVAPTDAYDEDLDLDLDLDLKNLVR